MNAVREGEKTSASPAIQVICVTYNQEAYIRDALDGFVKQKTTFPFEVIVADDCSTDGTSAIVAEYAKRYPDRITHLLREQNMGCLPNFIDACERITAPYAAFCDGDDYWTDENKLQKQYAYLERNPDVNVCAHRTKITAAPEWALYDYYQKRGFLVPWKAKFNRKLHLQDIVGEWPHTSSYLIRWHGMIYPEWGKGDGIAGDVPVLFTQLGTGAIHILSDVMSVYRRGAGGVFDCNDSFQNFMLQSRIEMMRVLQYLKRHFMTNHGGFGVGALNGRLWSEVFNFLNVVVSEDRWDKMLELQEKIPEVYAMAKSVLVEYHFRVKAINVLGIDAANLLFRGNRFLHLLKVIMIPFVRARAVLTRLRNRLKNAFILWRYWWDALYRKDKDLWVFSGFKGTTYLDNSKYLYEHVVVNHPEIRAVWLTRSKPLEKALQAAKMPVCNMDSRRGHWFMKHASVAVIDHFKMMDFSQWCGFNARTKLVNLWHGMGLKNMAPEGDRIPNTATKGVQLSSDILPQDGDGRLMRLRKKVRYFFRAPFRELFERYFMIVCPSQAFIDNWAAPLRLPRESWFMCGYPRNINFFRNEVPFRAGIRIIYAPTYRMSAPMERHMVDTFLRAVPEIDAFLERRSAEFVLRLHPHTWRDYSNDIKRTLANRPRFSISSEPDIYKELHEYTVMIADYSSITQDYLVGGHPVVYFAFDREEFLQSDCGLNMSYEENCAGPVATTWTEAIAGLEAALDNPGEYAEKRRAVCEKFFPSQYNDADNAERIVAEIKRRLGIQETK